jgi:DNA-binding NtrC family response regulator
VREGRFREDLYYRLNVIPIHLPPLREREHDSTLIAREFLKKVSDEESKQFREFSPEAVEAIITYSWPGNVRELENVIRRVVVFNNGETITARMLPETIFPTGETSPLHEASEIHSANEQHDPAYAGDNSEPDGWVPRGMSLAEIEREIIEEVIRRSNDNVTEAAKQLDVSPSTLYRKRATWAKQQ